MQWKFGPFRLDTVNASLYQDDKPLSVRPKSFEVLAYLVAHAGDLVSTEDLLDQVWAETAVGDAVLHVSIGELRKLFGETSRSPQYIATVPRRGYRFIAPVSPVPPLETPGEIVAEPSPPLDLTQGVSQPTPALFVGREHELAQLLHCFNNARAGQRQVVLVSGEAGIGKTTLIEAFVERLSDDGAVWIGYGQCIEQYGAGEAYLPLLEALGRLGRDTVETDFIDVLTQHAPSWLVHMPALTSPETLESLRQRGSGATRERMLRELAEALETLTTQKPLVLVLEDLHWSDASTLEWLNYVARRRDRARLLVLGTYRPLGVVASDHPLRAVSQELLRHQHSVALALDYLPEHAVAAYLTERFRTSTLPEGLAQVVHQRTNGNPLFLINVVDTLVAQEQANVMDMFGLGGLDAVSQTMPESLSLLIEQLIEQLDLTAQSVLEAASVAGAEFESVAVAAGIDQEVETVEAQCASLARRGQLIQSRETSFPSSQRPLNHLHAYPSSELW